MSAYPELCERQTAIARVLAAAGSLSTFASESTKEVQPAEALSELHSEIEDRPAAPANIQLQLNKLRADAAECVVISSLATDAQKRVFFEKLGAHLSDLASEIERTFSGRDRRHPLPGSR